MNRRYFAALAIATACMAATIPAAPARAEAAGITVTDTEGRTVTVPAKAERILLGFYFEDFYAVGGPDAYDRVVAISRPTWEGWRNSQWQAYTAVNPRIESLIDVGEVESGTFSVETAIAAKPDLAILAAWQFNALGDTVAKLEAAGIPVVVADYNAQTLEKHLQSTRLLGKLLGREDRAEALAGQYAAAVADVQARVAAAGGDRPAVYVELAKGGPGQIGNSYADTMWGRVIELAGGRNIARDQVANYGPLNPEYVLAQNPAVVLLAGSYWVNADQAVLMGFGTDPALTRERLRAYAGRPGWSGLDAVRNGQVHAIYHGGSRTLYDYAYLQYIAKAMYPDAFADIDPLQTLKDYYAAWLPIAADGAFMVRLDD